MLIDWFTVGAQAINFIVLVWLLKRFLYKPILAAIDARERRIAVELAAAARTQQDAQKLQDDYNDKHKHLEDERTTLLADAVRDAKTERERLLTAAQRDAADLVTRQRSALRAEGDAITDRLMQLVTTEVFAIARQALRDLASSGFEERLADVFAQRLRDLPKEAKTALGAALELPDSPATVRSHFDLGDRQRAAIGNAVNETFAADVHLIFQTAPQSDCGIELTVGGQRLAWGIHEYLDSFQAKTDELLGARPVAAA